MSRSWENMVICVDEILTRLSQSDSRGIVEWVPPGCARSLGFSRLYSLSTISSLLVLSFHPLRRETSENRSDVPRHQRSAVHLHIGCLELDYYLILNVKENLRPPSDMYNAAQHALLTRFVGFLH